MQNIDFHQIGITFIGCSLRLVDEFVSRHLVALRGKKVGTPGETGMFIEVEPPFEVETCHCCATRGAATSTKGITVCIGLTNDSVR